MVNSKKNILERYSILLERNLILTDDLFHWLKDEKIFPDFIFDDIQALRSSVEKNKKLIASVIENGDAAFTIFVEGLITNGQPFLGELLEYEDRKASQSTDDPSEQVVIDDEMLKKCPGVDKLRSDTRDKLKTYLQEQLLRIHLHDVWKGPNQGKSVEVINLKRQNYENQRRLSVSLEGDKQTIVNLKDALRNEQLARQEREQEMKELRNEVIRIKSEFEQKWSGQIKMVDANNRSVFKMHDKMIMLTDWLSSLDEKFNTSILQSGIDSDSMDQLDNKLKRFAIEIESLHGKGIGTDKLKEQLYESIYTSRYLPIEDRNNKPFHDVLVRLYGSNQVTELAAICTKDVLQSKQDRENANELKWRDEKIERLTQMNQELNEEVERLRATLADQSAKKAPWRPAAASGSIPTREPSRTRQTLKPANVQFASKPGAT